MSVYATTALDLDDDSLPRLRARLLAGPGAQAFEPMIAAYRDAAGTVAGVAADLADALRRHDGLHAGRAAAATRAHLGVLLQGVHADADRLARAVVALQDQAAHHEVARREVAAADASGPSPSGAAAMLSAVLAGPDPARRARDALAVYERNSNHTLSTALPVFSGATAPAV